MDESRPSNIPSPSTDPPLFAACGATQLTTTNSDSSAVIVNASKDLLHPFAHPFLGQSTNWTNEQHSLYLSYLEASFVKDLHHSMRFHGFCLKDNLREAYPSKMLKGSCQVLSEQYLVLQDGCWKNSRHERNEPMLDSTADSHGIAGSIAGCNSKSIERGYLLRESSVCEHGLLNSEGRINSIGNLGFSRRSSRSSGQHHSSQLCPLDVANSSREGMDQNFEDQEEGTKSRCAPMAKRLKVTIWDDAASNDQVVPFTQFHCADVSAGTSSSSENQGRQELLSEHPEGLSFQKTDLHRFLRGS